MASKPVGQLSAAEKDQLAVSYAAFVLSGQGAQVNEESLNTVLEAAKLKVPQNLVRAVSKALTGRNVTEFFGSISAGAPQASQATDKKADEKKDAKKDKKEEKAKEPPPPPPEEEEDMEMGGLFD
jgi:ribosomal protein L12E/L44/L45/RPP1/RPP2